MRFNILYITLMLALNQKESRLAEATMETKSFTVNRKMEQLCGSYTYGIVKPLLTHIEKINVKLEKSDVKVKEIRDLKEMLALKEQQLSQCQAKIENKPTKTLADEASDKAIIMELKSQISFKQKIIENLSTQMKAINNCEQLKECASQISNLNLSFAQKNEEIMNLNNSFNNQLNDYQKKDLQIQENLKLCQNEIIELKKTTENPISNSCSSFGNSTGVHKIKISELGTIDVLCDSQTVGDGYGWIVIQQRINGKEDFYRDWNTYRNGFGSYVGDFFIGLEKLHQLTKDRQQELYIYMKRFNGSIDYARYDNFKVGSEEEDYPLSSLGEFSSNGVRNGLKYHQNQKFTTYDRENDQRRTGNCAIYHGGGWWYNSCTNCNLNGKYSDVQKKAWSTVFWTDYEALKEVKMLIRPKAD